MKLVHLFSYSFQTYLLSAETPPGSGETPVNRYGLYTHGAHISAEGDWQLLNKQMTSSNQQGND